MSDATLAVADQPKLRSEVALGYALQLLSLGILLAQHALLPLYLGLSKYGLIALVVGSAGILHAAYDHGYNLLTVRKPSLASTYLAYKIALYATFCLIFGVAASLLEAKQNVLVPVFAFGAAFILYTHWNYHAIAIGRISRVVRIATVQGVLLVVVPLLFDAAGISVAYAPVVAMWASIALIVLTQPAAPLWSAARRTLMTPIAYGHLARTFVKQAQISIGTILDGTIVGLGIMLVVRYSGLEAGGVFRVVMSVVGLLTTIIPMPKHVLLKNARRSRSVAWAGRYVVGIVLIASAQWLAIRFLGRVALGTVVTGPVDAILFGVTVLAPVAGLKAIFEIETIIHDVTDRLALLPWCVLAALPAGIVTLLLTGVYGAILVFYLALGTAAGVSLLRPKFRRTA